MSRLLMPLLLAAAVGLPIWHVLSPKPWETNVAANANPASLRERLPSTQFAHAPISVYSQASYANPASTAIGSLTRPTFVDAPSNGATITGLSDGNLLQPFAVGARMQGQVVSSETFQAMGGQTLIFAGDANAPDLSAPQLEFAPIANLDEIIRFDIDPNWVKQRWQRVSTSPGEDALQGLRVALVTGTNTNDLHGSLTYYFDASQRLQRISFRGWTGDSTKLLQLVTQKYRFQAAPTRFAGLFLAKKRNVATSGLVMKHPVVIRADNPAQQVAVAFEINNANSPHGLSQTFHAIITDASISE